jgi:hypothetical protein
MRILAFLVLAGCPKGWPATGAPVEFDDAVCFGFGFGAAASGVWAQAASNGYIVPGVDVNVGGCANWKAPLTCEEQAKVDAWVAWSRGAVDALNTELGSPDGIVSWPAVVVADCP